MPSDVMLDRYAQVAIDVGLGIRPGDRLLIGSPLGTADFVRRLAEAAYAAGATNVDVVWDYPPVERARFDHGTDAAVDTVADSTELWRLALEQGSATLKILAEDPDAFAGVDLARVKRFRKVNNERIVEVSGDQMAGRVPWCVVAAPWAGWTETVFPGRDDATERLWDAIFRACRIDVDDPVAAWREHAGDLVARRRYLTCREYSAIRYDGPGTDVTFGLPTGARWEGGGVDGPGKRTFMPNIPTEEVFTVPHRMHANGHIRATKPLTYFGTRIDGFAFEIADGRVVSATAETGRDALDQILETDEGSVRFGELAMVPQSSAVAAEGLVWNNMLFDENDACHIALGLSFPTCVEGAMEMSPEERLEAGLNHSALHVDFVVGSPELDVFGVRADGSEEPIIAAGEWGFDV